MILGKRVRLCPIEHDNLPFLADWLNDPDVRRYLSFYLPVSISDEEKWLKVQQEKEPAAQPFLLEVKDRDGWLPIGEIGFHNLNLHAIRLRVIDQNTRAICCIKSWVLLKKGACVRRSFTMANI